MDKKLAMTVFSHGERGKSELMIAAQMITFLSGLKDAERSGGRKVVLHYLESVRMELQFSLKATDLPDFQHATEAVSRAISLTEGGDFDQAVPEIATAISAVTTAASKGWQVLEEHGYL